MKYPLNFRTTHGQFYIYDKYSSGNTASDNFWTDEAFNCRLAIEDGIVGVGLECYGPVKGEVELLDRFNVNINLINFDHVVEGSLVVKSGIIQILSCPNSLVQLELPVEATTYRVRVYSSNLASVDGDSGEDFYRIEIWPDSNKIRKVLKQYSNN
jgi:hypothetical protein